MSQALVSEAESELRMEGYFKLLLEFQVLPRFKRSRTFMEVSGYPHFENVCSNILRFYFDPSAEHGLKDLLLSSYLQMAGVHGIPVPEKVSLSREHPAEDQKRIDLVIDCETFTLGIENKIFHWKANDFANYGRVIDRLGRNKKTIKTVLCLRKTDNAVPLKCGFTRHTYGELWQQVRRMLGNYISNGDPKWVSCLLDFMQTTTNLAGENMEHKKMDQFLLAHFKAVEELVAEHTAFMARLNQKVERLRNLMQETPEVGLLSGRPWIFQKACLVLDFNFKDIYEVHLDLHLRTTRPSDGKPGWEMHLFCRNKSWEP